MTFVPPADASVLAAIAENPNRAKARAAELLPSLSAPAKEIASALFDAADMTISPDARATAEALREWASSNRTQRASAASAR